MKCNGSNYPTERINRKVFDSLGEYSCSIPTGTTIGKVWKRDLNKYCPDPQRPGHYLQLPEKWIICEYVRDPLGDPKMVGIEYRWPEIIEEPTQCL